MVPHSCENKAISGPSWAWDWADLGKKLIIKLQQCSSYEVIEDILPFVLNTKRPLSDTWLLSYEQNSFGCFFEKNRILFFVNKNRLIKLSGTNSKRSHLELSIRADFMSW